MASKLLRIGLIPGDGIGKEVIPAGRRVLEALSGHNGLQFSFVDLDAGFEHWKKTSESLPKSTVDALKGECNGALFGAVSSPTRPTPGYSSAIVKLRKEMKLYANVRPVKTVTSATTPVDLVIVRENTEDLYVKEEKTVEDAMMGKYAEAIKRISQSASERIAIIAGEIALQRQRVRQSTPGIKSLHSNPKVTVTHKSNVLPQTDGLFRKTCLDVLGSERFKSLTVEEQIIDSMFYKLYRDPSGYDVIVAPNLYGDLLSDGAAALVGSLGVVPSANVGDGFAIGEPCHGSAPDIEGKGIANPVATIRSVGCMLEFLGEETTAAAIYKAVDANLEEAKIMTPDLGGKSTTEQVVEDILQKLQ